MSIRYKRAVSDAYSSINANGNKKNQDIGDERKQETVTKAFDCTSVSGINSKGLGLQLSALA